MPSGSSSSSVLKKEINLFYLKPHNRKPENFAVFDPTIFQDRLRKTLAGFKISRPHLAQFGFVSKTTLDYWINGRSKPTIDALVKLAAIFGISLDWISGISPSYYSQPYIAWLEYSLFPMQLFIVDGEPAFYPTSNSDAQKKSSQIPLDVSILSIPKEYADPRLREIYYDQLDVRTNIIFLLNLLKLDILTNALSKLDGEETTYYVDNTKLNPQILTDLRELLFGNPRLGLPEEIAKKKFYKSNAIFNIPRTASEDDLNHLEESNNALEKVGINK